MAKAMKWVVRVVIHLDESREPFSLVESFRYAGLVKVHPTQMTSFCFDMLPPHVSDSKIWAEMNAERMRSFGYNAEAAPQSP